jgi:hypothetical protein
VTSFDDYKRFKDATNNELMVIITIKLEILFGYFTKFYGLQGLQKNWIINDFGHFFIIYQVNPIVFLKHFLRLVKIHLIFHVLLLEPFHESTIPKKHPITFIKNALKNKQSIRHVTKVWFFKF